MQPHVTLDVIICLDGFAIIIYHRPGADWWRAEIFECFVLFLYLGCYSSVTQCKGMFILKYEHFLRKIYLFKSTPVSSQ